MRQSLKKTLSGILHLFCRRRNHIRIGFAAFPSASMQEVRRAETLWLRINGVLLILLGLTLVASPRISYTRKEKVVHTPSMEVTAKRQKTIVIPRAVGALIIGAGVTVLIFATRKPQH